MMRLHHIGIACADIDQMKQYMEQLYDVVKISDKIYDNLQETELCMITLNDGTQVELVNGKPVEKLVKKRQFLYHICYSTNDIEKKIEEMESMGAKMISEPKEAVLFGEKKVAFLMTQMGLVELLEEENSNGTGKRIY